MREINGSRDEMQRKRSRSEGERATTVTKTQRKRIRAAKTYTELPGRYVAAFPYSACPFLSFGVIAHAHDTGRWLLVKRRHSFAFLTLVRGSYRLSEVKYLLPGLSRGEIDRLSAALETLAPEKSEPGDAGCAPTTPRVFERLFFATVIGTMADMEYARRRLEQAAETIRWHWYLEPPTGTDDTEWLWPKGRSHRPGEPNRKSALREFAEETGITIGPGHVLISETPLIDTFVGLNGRHYETRSWIYAFPREVPVRLIIDVDRPGEIGDRRWVTAEDAERLLSPAKFALLLKAQEQIAARFANANDATLSGDP